MIILKFTEVMLNDYSQPLSEAENNQCKNAIRMIADALKGIGFSDNSQEIRSLYPDTYAYSLELRNQTGRRIKIFIQGSYANNTNVRTKSDVDVAVIQEDIFTTEYRTNTSFPQNDNLYGFVKAKPISITFKDEVLECLKNKFGNDVERKNKSIKVHGNTYRKDADTVPCRRYRDYRQNYGNDPKNYIGGVVIQSDEGETIINYPEQHIENGKNKNNTTNHYYKKLVRIMKKMRYLMEESNNVDYIKAARNVNSFMLESLLWNIDDNWYLNNCSKYTKVIAFWLLLLEIKRLLPQLATFKEANGIKPLCPSTIDQQRLSDFINQLLNFYEI